MRSLVIGEQGAELALGQGRFEVRIGGQVVRRVRIPDVNQILLLGRIALTAEAVETALRAHIEVAYLTRAGRFRGRLTTGRGPRADLTLAQYRTVADNSRRLAMAAAFVRGKILNQRQHLLRAQGRLADPAIAEALAAMRHLAGRAPEASSLDQLLGFEGQSAALYWAAFGKTLTRGGFTFTGRRFRPPPDPLNACLSFGYAILTSICDSTLRLAGLDPGLGFLHEPSRARASLALDVMEEFRPIVVDRLVVSLINHGQLVPSDFETPDAESRLAEEVDNDSALTDSPRAAVVPVYLGDRGRKVFLREFYARLRGRMRYEPLEESRALRDIIMLQSHRLARAIEGAEPAYVAFTPR